MNKELVFLRAFAVACAAGMIFLMATAFQPSRNQRFGEIDVERINIVEGDGTVKMVITNVERFPTGDTQINDRPTNEDRKKRAGMLFFNEDGIECGGFIYDGKKNADGHTAGLSLTYDQYDGDQVMQLLTQDMRKGDNRFVGTTLVFNDRPTDESQLHAMEGGVPRVMLGKTRSQNNGLFLFDDQGMPRAMFYVDQNNQAKLDFFDEKGETIYSLPEMK